MLIEIDERTWVDPCKVSYLYIDSDGDVIIGCGGETFTIFDEGAKFLVNKINDAIAIENAFDKVKA